MIFYFTGTGNSLYAAQYLGMAFGENLVNISEAVRHRECHYNLESNEKVGFVFPVYYYGIPSIVWEFLDKLTIKPANANYFFAVLTCAKSMGSANTMLKKKLDKKGYELHSCCQLTMPDNDILHNNLSLLEEQAQVLASSEKQLKEIEESIGLNKKVSVDQKNRVLKLLKSYLLYPIYQHGRKTKKFYADERCTGCGLCEIICPVGAIEMRNKEGVKKPEWIQKTCVHCLACINRCPSLSIQYGTSTEKKERYIHPILRKQVDRNRSDPDL